MRVFSYILYINQMAWRKAKAWIGKSNGHTRSFGDHIRVKKERNFEQRLAIKAQLISFSLTLLLPTRISLYFETNVFAQAIYLEVFKSMSMLFPPKLRCKITDSFKRLLELFGISSDKISLPLFILRYKSTLGSSQNQALQHSLIFFLNFLISNERNKK